MTAWIILLTIAGYFALLFLISWLTGRKADNRSFFTGGRKSSWLMVTVAMIGASISGVTFISVPGAVQAGGYAYMQMVLGFFVGSVLVAWVLIPTFYRMNLVSIYGYLERRFGLSTYRTGAWFFFVSKMLGASVRFFVVCVVLQTLVFDPLGVPFTVNVVLTVALIWLYSFQGGVKSLIWTDALKTLCLVLSVVCCIGFIAHSLGLGLSELPGAVASHPTSRVFFLDDPNDGRYFWKQFIAGIFGRRHGRRAVRTGGVERGISAVHRHRVHHRADSRGLFGGRLRPDGTDHLVHRGHPASRPETRGA